MITQLRQKIVMLAGFFVIVNLGTALVPQIATSAELNPFDQACSNGATAQGSDFCKNVRSESRERSLVFGTDSLLVNIVQVLIMVTGAVSVVMIIIGGFKYVLSNGDSSALGTAKNTILYAVIGLVIAISSWLIVGFVLSRFK